MKRRRAGLAILVLLATLLMALPAVPGCGGGGGGEENVLKIGVMADFTGTAGSAMQPTIQAFEDYILKEVVFPGDLKVEFEPFDTQLNYKKTVPGYLELKGRGVKMMVVMNAQDRERLAERPEEDSLPTIGTMGLENRLDDEWMLTTWSPIQSQGEVEMLFIMDNWDYAGKGRSPRVGHLGYDLSSSDYYQEGIEKVRAANPDKFTWVGFERGTLTQVAWDSEVGRLKDCDYIIASVAGTLLSSFCSQARAKGYAGAFVTGMEGFPGFWPLVVDQVASEADLHDCYYVAWWRWWNEAAQVPLVQDCKEYIESTYSGAKATELLGTSSTISGRELGVAMELVIKAAIDAVGVENLDGAALQAAMRSIDYQPEGYLDNWEVQSNTNCLQWSQRAFAWDMTDKVWEPLEKVYEPTLTRPAA